MEQHSANDSTVVSPTDKVIPDDRSWGSLALDAVQRLTLNPDYLENPEIVNGPAGAASPCGDPHYINQVDALNAQRRYYIKMREYMDSLKSQYEAAKAVEGTRKMCTKHSVAVIKLNNGSLAFQEGVDYESW